MRTLTVSRFLEKLTKVEDAISIIENAIKPVDETIRLPTWNAIGMVLAEDIVAPYDFPQRPRVAYDGYAVRSVDTPGKLKIVGEATIGRIPSDLVVSKDTAVYVSTGSFLPEGADTVVPEEEAKRENEYIIITKHFPPGKNFDPAGTFIRKGEKILSSGYVVTLLDVVSLLDIAITEVTVYRKINLAILVTGSELFEPKDPRIAETKIKNGEVAETTATLIENIIKTYTPWVDIRGKVLLPDDAETISWYIERQYSNFDIILMTGGTGPSNVDTFYQLASLLEGKVLFRGLFLKGGRPTSAMLLPGGSLLVALSGYPISALHGFLRLVYPILKYIGNVKRSSLPPFHTYAKLAEDVKAKRPQPLKVKLFVKNSELYAVPLSHKKQLSSATISNVEADGIAILSDNRMYTKGEKVPVFIYREPYS